LKDEIATDKNHEPILDLSEWLSRATLDIIGEGGFPDITITAYANCDGLAGFDFDFGALDNSDNAVTRMYKNLL